MPFVWVGTYPTLYHFKMRDLIYRYWVNRAKIMPWISLYLEFWILSSSGSYYNTLWSASCLGTANFKRLWWYLRTHVGFVY
ncbi:hypothetical protein RHGRI_004194 [Rhododendron griersonianum]|uniref:Uncharacterized protein n=1 Tax=Rhododendron griersonianum TaxID=479676 RepID=A0AAV6L8I8_9ERIC|nr:hypothetical protein RHGRI_004194 [Rhododendron griersonianum]